MSRKLHLAVLGVLLSGLAAAQEFRATLTGRVLDASSAAVPNVTVQARNIATNETGSATTDNTGIYSIPFLRPGQYVMTAEGPGFKKFVREGLTLQVGQTATINIDMQVGAVTESVSVTAETPLLEVSDASRGGVVDSLRVSELPLNARNPYILGAMMSGVTFRGAAIWQRPFDNGAIAEWSINGGRQSNNEFLLDGAPNNAQAGGNNVAYVPIVDAVQEFRVQSNIYDAQYGKTAGGVMNVVLKSGTNQLHATGWEFARRKWLDANTFQNNAARQPRANHTLDQYGFQVEGPIFVPKLFDGRDKAFFLVSYEGYREDTPNPLNISVPEPEIRNGDFSRLRAANGDPIIIYNPFTARTDANGNIVRDPFPGNVIPQNLINPVARRILSYFPAPNRPTPGGQRYSTQNLFLGDYFNNDKFYNLIFKFDFNFGQKDRAFFRHASNDRTEERATNGIITGPGQEGQQPFQRINDAYVIDWVRTISPTVVLNVRGSYNRFIEKGFGRDNIGFDATTLGFPSSLVSQLPGGAYFGRYEFNGYNTLGRYQSINITNNYSINGNVNWVRGSHSMHFGLDVRRIHYILQNTGNIFQLIAQPSYTLNTYPGTGPNSGSAANFATSGDSIASFLLGLPSGGSLNYPLFPFLRQWYAAPFFQDDWKVTRRLTLNLGFRWDFNYAPDEKYNRIQYGFDTTSASPVAAAVRGASANCPACGNLVGGLAYAGVNGNPTKTAKLDLTNLQPRIGVAYQLRDNLVLRGGFGTFFYNPNNDWLNQRRGFEVTTPLVSSLDDGRTPIANLLSNPYPNGIINPPGAAGGLNNFLGQGTEVFNPEFRVPYVQQFSFGFQYQLPAQSVLDISYIGSRGYQIQTDRLINEPSLAFRRQCNPLEGGDPNFCSAQLTNPFRGLEPFRGTNFFTANTLSRYDLNRPYPQFGGIRQRGLNDGRTWYNSMQVNYTIRLKGGLNLLGNYTWSKFMERCCYIDDIAGVQQQSLYFLDRPHVVKLTAVYQLPFGQGKRFLNSGGFVNKLFGGWEATTFLTAQSGEPIDWQNNSSVNYAILRDPKLDNVDWKQHQVYVIRPCVLQANGVPQPFSVSRGCGTDPSTYNFRILPNFSPRQTPFRAGNIRMANTYTTDASLNKTTMIGDRFRVQFRLEAFNLFNTYAIPRARINTNANDVNFGSVFPSTISTVDSGFPRQLQLGVKLYW